MQADTQVRPRLDVAILTVLPDEYEAVRVRLTGLTEAQHQDGEPNLYAERVGEIQCSAFDMPYRVLIGMIGRAGTTNSALATVQVARKWRPRYVFVIGIAGGFHKEGLQLGDVVISDVVYGYEYGKLEEKFIPRLDWTFRSDLGLLNGCQAFAESDPAWIDRTRSPSPGHGRPSVLFGRMASGDKVVDNPNNEFFAQALRAYPGLLAVEMEGAGAAQAVENLGYSGISIGFIMIRGISDMPREEDDLSEERGTLERDRWTPYAADVAAAFTVSYIASGLLPLPPGSRVVPAPPVPGETPMSSQRTPNFTGRKRELGTLIAALHRGHAVTITGPGGVGKSALAAEALQELARTGELANRFPDGVFIYDFYNSPEADFALAQIASWFGSQTVAPSVSLAAQRSLRGKRALLVLDGTEEADDLSKVLAARADCGVLITTQSLGDVYGKHIPLGTLSEAPVDEGVILLRKLCGTLTSNEVATKRICDLVGRLPLALELAGRYMSQENESAVSYLQWLENTPLRALELPLAKRQRESVSILIARNLQRVSEVSRDALSLIGQLGLEPVPRIFIAAAFDVAEEEMRGPLGELVNYHLLQADEGWFSVTHRLVHTYAGAKLNCPDSAIQRLAWVLIAWLRELSGHKPAEWVSPLIALRTHVMALLGALRRLGMWRLVDGLATELQTPFDTLGFWLERLRVCELGLEAVRAQEDSKREARWLNALGRAHADTGRAGKAIEFSDEALRIAVEAGHRREEGESLAHLGMAFLLQDNSEEALKTLSKALAISQETDDQGMEAAVFNSLGSAYRKQGLVDKAIEHYERSVEITRQLDERRQLGNSLGNLGNAHVDRGEYEEAGEWYGQALEIFRQIGDLRGEASQLAHLGTLHLLRGDTGTAGNYLESALLMFRHAGDKSREAAALSNLGSVSAVTDDLERAVKFFEEAMAIFRKLGNQQMEAELLYSLGRASEGLGRIEDAKSYYEGTLTLQSSLGVSPKRGELLARLGHAQFGSMQWTEARRNLEQALPILRKAKEKTGVALVLADLGATNIMLGEPRASIGVLNEALTLFRELGEVGASEGMLLSSLGFAHEALKEYEQAIRAYKQALSIARLNNDRSDEAHQLIHLGHAYVSSGEPVTAAGCLERAMKLYREMGLKQVESVSLADLGEGLISAGRPELAIECYEAALEGFRGPWEEMIRARILGNLGNAYLLVKNTAQAVRCYEEVLTLALEAQDLGLQRTALANLGYGYSQMDQRERAIKHLEQAVAIKPGRHDPMADGSILEVLGTLFRESGKWGQAIESYEQALRHFRLAGDREAEWHTTGDLAHACFASERFEEAIEYSKLASVLSLRLERKEWQARFLGMAAHVSIVVGKVKEAKEFARKALQALEGDQSGDLASQMRAILGRNESAG